MKPKLRSLVLLCCLLAGGISSGAPAPEESAREYRLGNAHFAVTVSAPVTDWVNQIGPRFDTVAAVTSARLDGQEYLVEQGLADEFNPKWIAPPGYNEAKPGEPFLKLGIGTLVRLDRFRYLFGKFPVRKLAPNHLCHLSPTEIAFCQSFDSGLGWAYTYEKTYRVDPARATVRIQYRLRNTGSRPLLTEQYNHNWISLGPSAPGACAITGPFTVARCLGLPFDGLEVSKGRITLNAPITQPSYATEIQYVRAWRNRLRLSNQSTGRWVEISGNFPATRLALFANPDAVCPEVYGQWNLPPGKSAEWERRYRFGR